MKNIGAAFTTQSRTLPPQPGLRQTHPHMAHQPAITPSTDKEFRVEEDIRRPAPYMGRKSAAVPENNQEHPEFTVRNNLVPRDKPIDYQIQKLIENDEAPSGNMQLNATASAKVAAGTFGMVGSSLQTPWRKVGLMGPLKVADRARVVMKAAINDDTSEASDDAKPKFKPLQAYFVLLLVLMCRITLTWHRKGLAYTYGYTGIGDMAGNAKFELATAYPQLKGWYGLLSGLMYTIPYASLSLLGGQLTDSVNRKIALGIVVALASLTMNTAGAFHSFGIFCLMRMLHGGIHTISNPLSFSIISDYFPIEKRATANSMIQAGNYVGVAFGSISILLITRLGWRGMYTVMGGVGVALGLLSMLLIKEPERGQFLDKETKRKEAEKKVLAAQQAAVDRGSKNPLKNFFKKVATVSNLPCAKNVLIASALRNFGGECVSTFLPVFFGRNYPAYKAEYAMINAAAIATCGMTASLASGIIADKFEKRSYMTKAWLCIQGCFFSPFLIALGTLTTGNFYLSVLCYALKVLVSGTYSGPAITMIQNTSPLSEQGNAVSIYFLAITMAQTISPVLFTFIANKIGVLTNPALYGPMLTTVCLFSYLGSIPFWWKAGKAYKAHMEERDRREAEALLNPERA